MATSLDYYNYIMENLLKCGDVTSKRMMGEYCVYYSGKLVGDICDNTFFLKQTETSVRLLSGCERGYPYEGSKTLMLIVDDVENTELMSEVLSGMYTELPDRKARNK